MKKRKRKRLVFTLRLSLKLYELIQNQAFKEETSSNQIILNLLKQHFENGEKKIA